MAAVDAGMDDTGAEEVVVVMTVKRKSLEEGPGCGDFQRWAAVLVLSSVVFLVASGKFLLEK